MSDERYRYASPMPMTKDLRTTNEIADLFGVSDRAIRAWLMRHDDAPRPIKIAGSNFHSLKAWVRWGKKHGRLT